MTVTSLQQEISELDGVEAAQIAPAADGPLGVRISIRGGFDRASVARQVQEVLVARGLTSRVEDQRGSATPEHGEPEQAPVILGPARAVGEASGKRPGGSAEETSRSAADRPSDGPALGQPRLEPSPEPPRERVRPGVVSAAVSEGPSGLEVAVRLANGRRARCRTGTSIDAMHRAVVEAVHRAVGLADTVPSIQSIEVVPRSGGSSVTVVLEVDGQLSIGSAMVRATEVLAVAKATWAALTVR